MEKPCRYPKAWKGFRTTSCGQNESFGNMPLLKAGTKKTQSLVNLCELEGFQSLDPTTLWSLILIGCLPPEIQRSDTPKWRQNLKPEIYFEQKTSCLGRPPASFSFFSKSGVSHQSSFKILYPTTDSSSRRKSQIMFGISTVCHRESFHYRWSFQCTRQRPTAVLSCSLVPHRWPRKSDKNLTFPSPVCLKEGKMTCCLNI